MEPQTQSLAHAPVIHVGNPTAYEIKTKPNKNITSYW